MKSTKVKTKTIKMATGAKLAEYLSIEENFNKYKSAITSFFENGFDGYMGTDIMVLVFTETTGDYSWENEYELSLKKSTYTKAYKRLSLALKKIGKEDLIDFAENYTLAKNSLVEDENTYNDIVSKIYEASKENRIGFSYPSIKYFRDSEDWMKKVDFIPALKKAASKEDLLDIYFNGVKSISISDTKSDEYISISGRTSTWSSKNVITLVIYGNEKTLTFEVSTSETNRI